MLTIEATTAGKTLENVLFIYLANYMCEHRELEPAELAVTLVRLAAGVCITCDISKESFLRGAEAAYSDVLVGFEAERS